MTTPEAFTHKRTFTENPQRTDQQHRQDARACAAQWNGLHATVGSFADEHTTL